MKPRIYPNSVLRPLFLYFPFPFSLILPLFILIIWIVILIVGIVITGFAAYTTYSSLLGYMFVFLVSFITVWFRDSKWLYKEWLKKPFKFTLFCIIFLPIVMVVAMFQYFVVWFPFSKFGDTLREKLLGPVEAPSAT